MINAHEKKDKLDLARARAGVRVIKQFHSTKVLPGKNVNDFFEVELKSVLCVHQG